MSPAISLALCLCFSVRDLPPVGEASLTEGHARMLELLDAIRIESQESNRYLGRGGLRLLREQLAAPEPPLPRWRLERALGGELLRLGRTREAVAALHSAVEGMRRAPRGQRDSAEVYFELGTAYLRLAEDENCCLSSNAESCILPIQGGGLHEEQEGARNAIEWFTRALASTKPQSKTGRKARWLLNIAHMTLGTYPAGVPEEQRIDPEVFASERDFPRFTDVAIEVGLGQDGLAGGIVAEDFDGDGLIDLVVSSSDTAGQLRYYAGDPSGRFVEKTDEAQLTGLWGGLNLVSADYDGDGDVDVLVLRGAWWRQAGRHPNSLLENDGTGRFSDVTFEAGLGEAHHPTQTAAFADYDNDGDLDLYVGNESDPSTPAPCQLFRNDGQGHFVDVADEAGVTNGRYTKAVSWGDYDDDRFPDLYVSNMAGPNRLYRNQGDGKFTDMAGVLGVEAPHSGFPAWFFDYDGDGALDIFAASYGGPDGPPSVAHVAASYQGLRHRGEPLRLYRGTGEGGFEEVSREVGLDRCLLPMGSNFADVDGDGYLDLYLGTGYPLYEGLMPNVMYRGVGGRRFVDVTSAGGFGHLQKGHGTAFADLDGDGDLDVIARMGGAYPGDAYRCVAFENPGFASRWLGLRLVGETSNRFGVGARIRVDVVEGEGEERALRSIHTSVGTGGSFGCNPLRQHIGLGQASRIERLAIWWPTSDTRQVLTDVPLDQVISVREGAEGFELVPRRTIELGRGQK